MGRHLFTVDESFTIRGRGLVITPGLSTQCAETIQQGDSILLKHPDGSESTTSIAGLEMLTPNPRRIVPVLLKDLEKKDVPIGTEVWSVGT